jgi:hypothetical protein
MHIRKAVDFRKYGHEQAGLNVHNPNRLLLGAGEDVRSLTSSGSILIARIPLPSSRTVKAM